MPRTLLILRPQPGATATLAAAEALGLEAVVAPLFAVASLIWEPPDATRHDALMLTSANAVRHAGPDLARYHGLPTYAVGEATAAAARAAGFGDVRVGAGDAAALLARMATDGIVCPLHLAGRDHRKVETTVKTLTRRLVYAADPVAALPSAARTALDANAVALLHSPRAATLFAALVDAAEMPRAAVALAAISSTAASAAGHGWCAVAVAETPDDAALLAAAAGLCDEADDG